MGTPTSTQLENVFLIVPELGGYIIILDEFSTQTALLALMGCYAFEGVKSSGWAQRVLEGFTKTMSSHPADSPARGKDF